MSLINEALKRAEAEKHSRASEDSFPPLRPVETPPPRGTSLPVVLLGVASFITAGAAIWMAMDQRFGPRIPAQASAQARQDVQEAGAPSGLGKAAVTGTDADARRLPTGSDAEVALAKTLEALRYYVPPTTPQPAATTNSQAGTFADTTGAQAEATPPTQDSPGAPGGQQTAATSRAVSPPSRIIDFKVSAIMQSRGGNVAIINGRPTETGSVVDGAKVVRISRYSVDLELNGETFSIHMR